MVVEILSALKQIGTINKAGDVSSILTTRSDNYKKMNLNKQMRKILLLTALLGIMWGAMAQNTQTRAEVTLTLTLHPYLHIEAIQPTVNLDYKTIENHRDGVSVKMHDHLLVHSSSNFEVSAEVRNEHMANKYITITPERSTGTGGLLPYS